MNWIISIYNIKATNKRVIENIMQLTSLLLLYAGLYWCCNFYALHYDRLHKAWEII